MGEWGSPLAFSLSLSLALDGDEEEWMDSGVEMMEAEDEVDVSWEKSMVSFIVLEDEDLALLVIRTFFPWCFTGKGGGFTSITIVGSIKVEEVWGRMDVLSGMG